MRWKIDKAIPFYAIAAALCLYLGIILRFSTEFSLNIQGDEVIATVEQGKLSWTVPYKPITELSITSCVSPLPSTIENLVITEELAEREGLSRSVLIANKIHLPSAVPYYGIGDWSSELSRESEVQTFEISPGRKFKITGTIYGAALEFRRISLKSASQDIRLEIRSGYLNNGISLSVNNKNVANSDLPRTLSSYLKILSSPLLFSVGLALLCALVVKLWKGKYKEPSSLSFPTYRLSLRVLLGCSLILFAYVGFVILEGLPHFQDDLSYLIRARWLAEGMAFEPADKLTPYLNFPFTISDEDGVKSQYTVGWPILMVPFVTLNCAWLSPVLFGFLLVLGIGVLAKRLYSSTTAIFAVALALVSPIVQLISGSLLAHSATAAVIVWSAVFLERIFSKQSSLNLRRYLFGSSFLISFAFSLRPLTAMTFSIIWGLLILVFFVAELRARNFKNVFLNFFPVTLLGIMLGFTPLLVDNFMVTGDPFVFAYEIVSGHHLGISGIQQRMSILITAYNLMLTHIFPWASVGLSVLALGTFAGLFLPLLVEGASVRVFSLICGSILLPFAYYLHAASGAHGFGPRFYYEGFAFVFILTARSIELLLPVLSVRLFALFAILALGGISASHRLPNYVGYNLVSSEVLKGFEALGITRGAFVFQDAQMIAALAPIVPYQLTNGDRLFFVGTKEIAQKLTTLQDRPVYFWQDKKFELISTN